MFDSLHTCNVPYALISKFTNEMMLTARNIYPYWFLYLFNVAGKSRRYFLVNHFLQDTWQCIDMIRKYYNYDYSWTLNWLLHVADLSQWTYTKKLQVSKCLFLQFQINCKSPVWLNCFLQSTLCYAMKQISSYLVTWQTTINRLASLRY